jgi:Concanavalin A-like lectin/glucanases superfamily/Right handed beta helix region
MDNGKWIMFGFILIFSIFNFQFSINADAATRYASETGSGSGATCAVISTPCSLQTALQDSAPGDEVVLLNNSDWNGHMSAAVFSLPNGTAANPIVIRAQTPGGVILKPTNNAGILVYDNSYLTFRDIIIDGTNYPAAELNFHNAISLNEASHHIRFENMETRNWTNINVQFSAIAHDNVITGGSFHDCNSTVIQEGIGFANYAIYIKGQNNIIEYTELYNCSDYGIHHISTEQSASGNIMRFNRIYNTRTGIVIGSQAGPSYVYGNLLYGNTGTAMQVYDVQHIYNNTIYTALNQIGIENAGGGNVIRNNIIHNTNNPVNVIGNIPTLTNNLAGTADTGIATVELAATTFINPGSDFRLKAGSAAIGAGTTTGNPAGNTVDITGAPRVAPYDIGAYKYAPAIIEPPVEQRVVALPLDEGTGSTAADISGQKNNATLVGGATWDNDGRFGKAVALDGTGYLNIPASSSLALAPGMSLESWIYPTTALSGFSTVIRHDRYFLYAASGTGYCPAPALAPLGGYSSEANNIICATSSPPLNTWSHLAVTYDGTTMTFYLNGNIVASTISTAPMVPSSFPLTIGASQYGENFIGKIDQPMVYNYSRTPQQIVSDMNTSLIVPPGKYVEISAPTSVEISAASTLEIGAD